MIFKTLHTPTVQRHLSVDRSQSKIQRLFSPLVMVALLLSFSVDLAFAQKGGEGGKGSIGLLGGLAFPTTSSPVLAYGLDGHYRVWSGLGVGPFFQRFGVSATVSADTASATLRMSATYIGAQAVFQFAGTLNGFIIGYRTGVALVERYGLATAGGATVLSVDDLVGRYFMTLQVGYHYRIGRFSLGTELQGLLTVGGDAPIGVLLYFAPKFWF